MPTDLYCNVFTLPAFSAAIHKAHIHLGVTTDVLGLPCCSVVKDPLQVTKVRSLGAEDPLEKEMATHSSILTWKIPWAKEPGGLQSIGSQKSRTRLSN